MLYDPKPSEMSGYDKEKPESAYLSGILSSFQPTFLVGMYGLWYSNQNFDNTAVCAYSPGMSQGDEIIFFFFPSSTKFLLRIGVRTILTQFYQFISQNIVFNPVIPKRSVFLKKPNL